MNDILIKAEHIFVNYDSLNVLEDVDFAAPANAFITIIGPNGAGKSTLIKLIIGIRRPDKGRLTIDGEAPGSKTAKRVGYVPQFKNMNRHFPALAEELVYSGLQSQWPWQIKKDHIAKVKQAMDIVKVGNLAKRRIKELSGGELQRVCLARCIVNKPDIIVLDEPATGIDLVGETDMYKLLESYQRDNKATIIMITHDWHAARHHASHVLILNKKQIAFGPPDAVLNDENLRKSFGHTGHIHRDKKFGSDYV